MSRFDYMRNFVAVVDCGSITAAADSLELTVAAVSKRLKALETELGTRLLTRNTRQLALTEAGQYYYQHCRLILAEVERVDQELLDMQGKLSGPLRVNMPMTYGKMRIGRHLVSFLCQHPDIQLTAYLDDAYTDVASGDYDIVIRIGALEDSRLIARKLEDIHLLPVASPAYLQQHGSLQHPAELGQHQRLQYTNMNARDIWRFQDRQGEVHPVLAIAAAKSPLSVNNGEILRDAALAGLGIAVVPDFEVRPELQAGTLVNVLPDYRLPALAAYAVYPSRQFLPEKNRVLIDFLIRCLQADA